MLSTSQRAPGYRFQYQVPPTPLPASNTRAEKPSPRRRCSMYIPAKPAPTTTASKTASLSGERSGRARLVVSAVMMPVVSPAGRLMRPCEAPPQHSPAPFSIRRFRWPPMRRWIRRRRCRSGEWNLCWWKIPAPGEHHGHTARSRHCRDHSKTAVARSRDDDAAERPRCATCACRGARRGSAAAGCSAIDTEVKGAAGQIAARVYRVRMRNRRPWCFFTAAAGSPAISKPMTARPGCSRSRPAPWWSRSITAVRRKRAFPARSRTPSPPCAMCSRASPRSAATAARRRGWGQRRRQSGGDGRDRLPRCGDRARRAIAGLSRHRRRRKLCRRNGERALSLPRGKREGLFPVTRGDGMVLRPLS